MEDLGTPAQWIQTGGLAMFAAAVWFEVKAIRTIMIELRDSMTALLERDRMRPMTPAMGVKIHE